MNDDTHFVEEEKKKPEKKEEKEEIPLIGVTIDGIYTPKEMIGGGGACQVYKTEMNTHRYRAKQIIAGNMPLFALLLSNEDLGLPVDFEVPITDPEVIAKVYERADSLHERVNKMFDDEEKQEESEKDREALKKTKEKTRGIMQTHLMQKTHEDFRATENIIALKVLRESRCKEVQDDEDSLIKRFENEARLCKKYSHPNLVKSIDSGEEIIQTAKGAKKVYWYAMEYVNAFDLSKQLEEEGPISVKQGIGITKAILKACNYLHEKGTTHRDIKPRNALVDKASKERYELGKDKYLDARLTDLGLAKLNVADFESDSMDLATQLETQDKKILGTPIYMSPEQIAIPRHIGPPTDIWSLCAMMYYLYTGHFPFGRKSSSYPAIMTAIVRCRKPKPIREINPEVPQLLEDLIMSNLITLDVKREENDEGEEIVTDVKNTRMIAEELLLAKEDFERIQSREYTKEEQAQLEKGLATGKVEITEDALEKTADVCYELLNKIERKKKTLTEYERETIEKRKEILETAIKCTSNETRKSYLEKLLIYEKSFPLYVEPIKTVPTKVPSRIRLPLLLGAGVLALVGIIYGTIKGTKYLENEEIYTSLKNNITITAKQELDNGNISEAEKIYLDNLSKLNRLPEGYRDINQIFSNFQKNMNQEKNERIYTEADKKIQEAYTAWNDREIKKAGDLAAEAELAIKKFIITGSDGFKTKKEELESKTEKLQDLIETKGPAIATLDLVDTKYPTIQKTYADLLKNVEDGKPFPEQKEIGQLKKNLDFYNGLLSAVVEEFLDEKGNKTKGYTGIETKLVELIRKSNRLEFRIADELLKELRGINKSLSKTYFQETASDQLTEAETLNQQIQKIMQETSTQYLEPEKLEKFNENSSKEEENLKNNKTQIEYFLKILQKSKEGNQNAQEIIELEKRTCDSANHIYIRNGITTETITEYSNKVNTYLDGKNMRADTHIQLILDELSKKLLERKEMIEKLKEQAKPLFNLSWKIQELDGIIDEKPEDENAKQEREKAITNFTKTATELKKQYSALKLREYITQGTVTADPHDYFYLGKAYQARGDKKRAAKAYTAFLKTVKLGFQINEEEIKQAEEAIKLAEQK